MSQQTLAKVAENLYRNNSSGTYYVWVKRSGKQIKRSLKTSDLALAKRRLREFRDKVDRTDPKMGKVKISFNEVAAAWLLTLKPGLKASSYLRLETSIKAIAPYLGKLGIRAITRGHCEDWSERRGQLRAASTFNNELCALNSIMEYAVREGYILDNPAKTVKRRRVGKQELIIPTRDQLKAILAQLRGMDIRYHDAADLIELLAYSGMRKGEANEFRWKHIDRRRGLFVVTGGEKGTKNHDVRHVPLFPALLTFLNRRKAEVFNFDEENRVVPNQNAIKALEKACEILSFPHFNHHSMRHFFVSNAIEKNVDFKTIAAWVGHKDGGILVAQRYGHLRDVHSMEMAKRMTV